MKLPTVTQAFLIHFAISLVVFCALVAVMAVYWFPGNLFFMEGGLEGLKIIAPIDLVLGPALTLIFYRPWKKNVKFDMSVIVGLQIAALGYGVHSAHTQRTVAIVFAEDRFETLSYNEYKAAQKTNKEEGRSNTSIEEFGGKMPVIVYAEPFKGDDYRKYLNKLMNGGLELRERSDRYRLLSSLTDELDEFQVQDTPVAVDEAIITEIPASSSSPKQTGELRFPLKARFGSGEIVLDSSTHELLHITRDE